MTSPADDVRDLMRRYPANPSRTITALDALGRSEQAEAEQAAASVLAGYVFTAEDIADSLADGGGIRVIAIRDDPEATP